MTPFTDQEMQRLRYLIVCGLICYHVFRGKGWSMPQGWDGVKRHEGLDVTKSFDDQRLIVRWMDMMLST